METETPRSNENENTDDADINWEGRILCSDGNCIGVIGADGRCKECGKKYEGELPEKTALEQEDPAEVEDETIPDGTAESNSPEESPADDDWEGRVLCSDGNCIGVIGPDGKCKECGKPKE
jgi:hypothetical protein